MNSNIKTIIGWLLLTIGLVIIFWSLYSSYNIFSAKTEAPEIFKAAEKEDSGVSQKEPLSSEEQIKIEARKLMQEQLEGFLPTNFAPRLLNLISWSILVGILVFGGGKIALIGIKLL